jgi:membrane protein implicated in regulation of membrane protease activity
VLAEPIVNGQGRVRIDDTNWRLTGPDLPAGTRVKVIGTDGGAVLKVAAA